MLRGKIEGLHIPVFKNFGNFQNVLFCFYGFVVEILGMPMMIPNSGFLYI